MLSIEQSQAIIKNEQRFAAKNVGLIIGYLKERYERVNEWGIGFVLDLPEFELSSLI